MSDRDTVRFYSSFRERLGHGFADAREVDRRATILGRVAFYRASAPA